MNSGELYAGLLAGIGVGAMDGGVSSVPHCEKFLPHGGDDVGGPEDASVTIGGDLELFEVLILESGPFRGHAALEDLAPAQQGLFVNEALVHNRVLHFVKWCFVDPGIDAIEEDVS